MMKILRTFILLISALMLVWVAGCGEDNDDYCSDNVSPTVTLSPSGGDVFWIRIITATCSKPVEKLIIKDRPNIIVTSGDRKIWTFILPEGIEQSITVVCIDDCGDSGATTGTFNVWGHVHVVPEIKGEECKPKDGAVDIDPADISEITIVFTEPIIGIEITSLNPESDISSELDGDTLTISFLGGFKLSNEQEFAIEMTIENLVGDTADAEYSFTTKAKE